MKIAIVHEMLIKLGGAERVLQELINMYPEADVYTLMYDEKKVGNVFPKEKIRCDTAAQKLYLTTGKPRLSLPLMSTSVKGINLTGYDLVISSSSGFAHGAFTTGMTKHICYCHSPARYLWDWSDEVQKELGVQLEEGKSHSMFAKIKSAVGGPLVNGLFNKLRAWDQEACKRPTLYIANSREVQERIKKYYNRDSVVLWPFADVNRFSAGSTPVSQREFYVITSALTPFKRVDIPIRVLSKLGIHLKIIGAGDQHEELAKLSGPTIEFLGRLSDEEVAEVYKHARGFLMPQKEDAGIAPIEAMAAGLPVFGQGAGGLLETNIDGVTGRFFPHETDESFERFFLGFDHEVGAGKYDNSAPIIEHASKFDTQVFHREFQKIVSQNL